MCTREVCIFQYYGIESSVNIMFLWCNVSFEALLIFQLGNLSSAVSGVFRFPAITVFLSLSTFNYATNCFIYFGAPSLGAYILISFISLMYYFPYCCIVSIFIFCYLFYYEICLVSQKYSYTHFSLDAVCLNYYLLPLHFESLQLRCAS